MEANNAKIYVGTKLTTIFGQTYVLEGSIIEIFSFHFEEKVQGSATQNGSYISFATANIALKLEDGSDLPVRKYFMNPVYTTADRSFKGTISWGDNTFHGEASWDFIMVFSKDF